MSDFVILALTAKLFSSRIYKQNINYSFTYNFI